MRAFSRGAVLPPALLAALAADLGARLLSPREAMPRPVRVEVGEFFSAEDIRRGAGYARPQLALGLARGAAQFGLLATLAARRRGRVPPRRPRGEAIVRAAGTAAALAVAETAVGLPLAAVARRRSRAVGLVTQSWRGWAGDLAKSSALGAGFAAAGAGILTPLGRRFPRTWWAPAAAGSVLVGSALGALAPVVLDPLFNRFTPLLEGPLRTDVLALADAAGVRVGEVFTVDASRRSTAANAYVTGLGPTKRVVIFDTLLDRYSAAEIRSVVAHELAHVRHRDVLRSVAYAAIVAGPVSLAVQRLAEALAAAPTEAEGLPALAVAATLVSAPVGALGNRLSRVVERRADAFAVRLAPPAEAFISFERAIARQNVADLDPPRWVQALLATHPSTAERIGAALAMSRADGAP